MRERPQIGPLAHHVLACTFRSGRLATPKRGVKDDSKTGNCEAPPARLLSQPEWAGPAEAALSATPNLATEDTGASRSTRARVEASWATIGTAARVATLVACALSLAIVGAVSAATGYAVAAGLALGVLGVAAMVDAVEHRLPNVLLGLAAVPVVIGAAVAYVMDDHAFGSSLAGALFVAGPLLLVHLVSPVGMGFGDVKAAVVVGGAIGLIDDNLAIPALVTGLVLVAGWGLLRRRRVVPLGPGLVSAAILVIAVAQVVGS
jgi:leader peptidase (prepilin peptidase)/N-methyltransferase